MVNFAKYLAPACAGLALLGGAAHADDGFANGSFEGPAPQGAPAEQAAAPAPAPAGERFGGSFDDGSFVGEPADGVSDVANTADADTVDEAATEAEPEDTQTPQPEVVVQQDPEPGPADPPEAVSLVDGPAPGPDAADPADTAADQTPDVMPPTGLPAPGPDPDNPAGQVAAYETRDFGVPPQQHLRQGQFHAATPIGLPGGYLLTTQALSNALQDETPLVLIDVIAGRYVLPGAFAAPGMAQAGHFYDRTQQQTAQWLYQITGGDFTLPIVIYCSDPMCWLSYNAALRAIAAGYSNVYWYRGGVQAWQMAGLQMQPGGY